jgi:hypothetical protein
MAYEAIWVHGSTAVASFPGGAGPEGTNGHRLKQVRASIPSRPSEAANVPFSDLLGFRGSFGAMFRGHAGDTNFFVFSIPTPVFRAAPFTGPWRSERARLNDIVLLYNLEPGVEIFGITITDGGRPIRDFVSEFGTIGFRDGFRLTNDRSFSDPALTQEQVLAGIVEGVTRFTIRSSASTGSQAPELVFGVGINVAVRFRSEGNVTFPAVGAGFIVPDS